MELSDSTTSPALPILEEYPNTHIDLLPNRAKRNQTTLTQSRSVLPSNEIQIDSQTAYCVGILLPKLWSEVLPVYLEVDWFRPETLYINTVEQFRDYPTHLLRKLKAIHIQCSK